MGYIKLTKASDGIVDLVLDQPGKSVNVMGEEYDAAMREAVGSLKEMVADIKGVYISSGKPGQFFAGGDIKAMLEMPLDPPLEERQRMYQSLLASKAVLRELETLGVPVVVGINGAALGGGYELCLACHHRIALNSPAVRIGLPEAAIGLMPGAGGVVRTVRMLGMQAALELVSQGRQLSVDKALKKGLIDELAEDEDELRAKARAWILANPQAQQPWDKEGFSIPGGSPGDDSVQGMLFLGPSNVMNSTGGNMPSQRAIFAAVVDTARVDFDTAEKIEGRYFLHLLLNPVSRNMMTAFFVQMGAVNSGASRPDKPAKTRFKRIGIIGAGQMGAGIAFAAAKVGIEVILADSELSKAEKGRDYTRTVCEKNRRIDEQQAADILGRIVCTDKMEDFADCEAVIEAVFEDREVKADVTRSLAAVVGAECLVASNTSALPITELAEADTAPQRFIGMHFFSPAEKMPLVEIIRGRETSDEALAKAFDLARQLGKTPIVVNDAPGFFTTRVISQAISQGMQMVTEGVDPVTVENIARQAGYPVGPLALVDEISQQTSYDIARQDSGGTALSGENELIRRMVEEFDRRGKRYGSGFYDYPEGGGKTIWPGLRELYTESASDSISSSDIAERMLYAEALEAVRALEQGVINSVADANIGSIMGIGFPAYTGGVLQYINSCGVDNFLARAEELAERYGESFAPPELLRTMAAEGRTFS